MEAEVEVGVGGAIARAAIALIGVRFRLHGRCGQAGVDCVGLGWLSLCGAGLSVPDPPPYRLRAGAAPMVAGWMARAGFVEAGDGTPGDLLIVRVSMLQPHLMVDVGDGDVVHAHAGLGRVVRVSAPPEWPIVSRWRYGAAG